MTIEINVPDIGTDEVEVTEILVSVGDRVTEDQTLISVEGDKAAMEVPASQPGVVKEIKIEVGDKVATGSLIMVFETDAVSDSVDQVAATPAPVAATTATAAVEIKEVSLPDIGDDEVEVTAILVNLGDRITEEQPILSVEGDKASMEVPAPFNGVLKEIKVEIGDKVSTGSLVMVFDVSAASVGTVAAASVTAAPVVVAADKVSAASPTASVSASSDLSAKTGFVENADYAHASPVIRRLAREFGVNLAKVSGTGRKNRVIKADVQNYIKAVIKQAESAGGSELNLLAWPKVDFSKFGETEVKPLSRIQKISGANLHRNWVKIPHVTQWDNADITELEIFRKAQNAAEAKKDSGMKITPLVFIMKAVAKALEVFPTFNSSLSEDGESLIMKKYVNIGIAVDTPNGLVVPVFKDVNKKGIHELSDELKLISNKARGGKLTAADMQGGCFTISSLGGIGGTAFTPIVNAPEVAILGVSKSEMKPVWNGKDFQPRLMLPLSLSYDHRVVDGAEGARFINYLNSCLSDIRTLVL
ncbi:MAG: pyruvate dehydrogenase complex dihydrolipoyllysine-residue acetyltransferase [Shewanella sp.]